MAREADFSQDKKDVLAKRAGERCSNPTCRRATSRPHPTDETKFINVGEAAHIVSASGTGPRANPSMSIEDRKLITNGVWVCQQCHKMVDNNIHSKTITVDVLRYWKKSAEFMTARSAAFSEEKTEKVMVFEYIGKIIENGKEFHKKWSKVAKPQPPKENSSDRDLVAFLQNSIRQNTQKREEFESEILSNVNNIFEMGTIILGEGHYLIVELRELIEKTNDYNEEYLNNFMELLKKIVSIIDLN